MCKFLLKIHHFMDMVHIQDKLGNIFILFSPLHLTDFGIKWVILGHS